MTLTLEPVPSQTSAEPHAPTRTVMILKGAYEPHGGTESVLRGFLDHMDRNRYRPILVMLSKPGAPDVPPLSKHSDQTLQIRVTWKPGFGALHAARELAQLVDAHHVDLVHSHDSRSTLAARLLVRHRSIPWVAHMHGWLGKTGILKNQLVEAMAKRLQRPADLVIGGSTHTCSEVEHLGMKRIEVLPNGIAIPADEVVNAERDAIRSRLGLHENTTLCAVTARLHPGKGHTYLFDAIRQLRQEGLDVQGMVIGDGADRPRLESHAKTIGMSDFIHFVGRVPAVQPYLGAADIFCLPSLKESLSIAVLEAMAAGKPVVTTLVGDFHTLIESGENGVLVEPGLTGALADGLRPLIGNPKAIQAMGLAGRQTVADRFSVLGMTQKLEDLFDLAIKTHDR